MQFLEFKKPFPLCNHLELASSHNYGYVQGCFLDGQPFEAEVWEDGEEETLSVVMPELVEEYGKQDPLESSFPMVEGQPTSIHNTEERKDWGILTIGMVEGDIIENMNIVIFYIEYLESTGIVEFNSEFRNGSVQRFIDKNGTDLVRINITLITKDLGEVAEHDLSLVPFLSDYKCEIVQFPGK